MYYLIRIITENHKLSIYILHLFLALHKISYTNPVHLQKNIRFTKNINLLLLKAEYFYLFIPYKS